MGRGWLGPCQQQEWGAGGQGELAHHPISAGQSHSIQMALCMQGLLQRPGAEGCVQPGATQGQPPRERLQREVGAQPQVSG